MFSKKQRDRIFLAMTIIAVSISLAYWLGFSIQAYNVFEEYNDIATFVQSMYYTIHYTSLVGGLQLLVFANHIAPDQLLVLPIFYLYQSPLTLLFVQDFALCVTGLIIFFVVKDLLKSSSLGFLFGFAFLADPAMITLMTFDYHAEPLILPFYILTFYYYMKGNKKMFALSLLLLLGTLESIVFTSMMLGIGLLAYNHFDRIDKKTKHQRTQWALWIVVGSFLALGFYVGVASYLTHLYSTTTLYSGMPPELRVAQVDFKEVNDVVASLVKPSYSAQGSSGPPLLDYIGTDIWGMILGFMVYGISVLFSPLLTLSFSIPWFIKGVILKQLAFVWIEYQYYAYVLGGTFAGAIVGVMGMRKRRGMLSKMLYKIYGKNYKLTTEILLKSSILFISLLFLVMSYIYSRGVFIASSHGAVYSQLDSILSLVPANASVLANGDIKAHLSTRRYVVGMYRYFVWENYTWDDWYFKPQYVIVDFNSSSFPNIGPMEYANFQQFMAAHPNQYYLYAKNGSAELYKEINAT